MLESGNLQLKGQGNIPLLTKYPERSGWVFIVSDENPVFIRTQEHNFSNTSPVWEKICSMCYAQKT